LSTTRKRVFICSALRGSASNEYKALQYSKYAVRKGVSPYTPHVFLTRFLDDSIESERLAGMECGQAFLPSCHELWAFTVAGRISSGMRGEVEAALDLSIPVRWFAVEYEETDDRITPIELIGLPVDSIPSTSELLTPKQFAAAAQKTLDAVTAKLFAGDSYEDSIEDIDALLGTGLAVRDRQAESDWTNWANDSQGVSHEPNA